MIKLKALLVVRRIVSWQILCMDKSLLPNIEALYINSPVPPVTAEENEQQPRLFLCTFLLHKTTPIFAYVSFYKIYSRRGVFNAYLQNLLLDFSP